MFGGVSLDPLSCMPCIPIETLSHIRVCRSRGMTDARCHSDVLSHNYCNRIPCPDDDGIDDHGNPIRMDTVATAYCNQGLEEAANSPPKTDHSRMSLGSDSWTGRHRMFP